MPSKRKPREAQQRDQDQRSECYRRVRAAIDPQMGAHDAVAVLLLAAADLSITDELTFIKSAIRAVELRK